MLKMLKPILAASLFVATMSATPSVHAESARFIVMSQLELNYMARCPAGRTVADVSSTHSWIACSTQPPGFTTPQPFSWELWGFIKWYSSTPAGNSAGICSIGQVSDQACVDATPSWCRCFREITVNWTCR